MGRPPLNMKITTIRLPEETLKQIDALVGQHRRPVFIREAVERELERLKKERASEAT
ncbi:putative DNA-binding protein [Agrobacterium vitis]|nr:putative DNA-binding protein [Agrobacterium vitis]MBE1439756.1 putative DNA-binding protein [Agrobacterium vitis]